MADIQCRHYPIVPKGFQENLNFRLDLLRYVKPEGKLDHNKVWAVKKMCAEDILFYINAFVWTFNPKKEDPKILPFITYDYQDESLIKILSGILRGKDKLVEKSRDMGASWMCLVVFEWLWHFCKNQSFLLISAKEDLVDKSGDPIALMWKIDFIHKMLPGWLTPPMNRQKLHFYNRETASTIDGTSTTGNAGRGDRRTAFLFDEFAFNDEAYAALNSSRDATNCRLFNSTPNGPGNAFFDLRQTAIDRITLHWTLHPVKSIGLYYDESGKPRSPWYDEQCERATSPREIAQELDIDYLGSGSQYFSAELLERVKREQVLLPLRIGELDFDLVTVLCRGFLDRQNGRFLIWTQLDMEGKPPKDRDYVLGIDIAAGVSEASNSVISVGDRKTLEKVAEFAAPRILPSELAKYAVAIGHFFGGKSGAAYMIWEANGPGREFGNAVVDDLLYRNVYYRRDETSISKRTSDVPGWYATKDTKTALFGEYRRALGNEFINHSAEAVKECYDYVYLPGGSIGHCRSAGSIDPTGAKENHGDRVVADALCWKGLKLGANTSKKDEGTILPGSFMHRRVIRELAARELVASRW